MLVRHIAVIGGGLAGLVVALRRAAAGDRVTVLEASGRLGGQLWSERAGELLVEHGAEGFVAGSVAVRALAGELGLEAELVEQLVTRSYGFDGQGLRALLPGEAAGMLGFQVPRGELGKGIGSFRGGMGALVLGLERALGERVEVRLSEAVTSVRPAGAGVRVETAASGAFDLDAALVATTARAASALLGDAFGAPARALEASPVVSSVTVSLAYERASVDHPLDATGFVVAEAVQDEGFRACTFTSSKLPHRAPAETALLRLFFRPPGDALALSDDAWIARAERSLARAVRLLDRPRRAWVSRWPNALPVFDDAHRARVAKLEAALAGSGIQLAGSAFHGAGIDAAVRSAEAAALGISR